ncbi:MAG: 16S rRNA (guanine(527)-N(7))-methyltransferase RsmG [Bacteroidetes bacterium]|nr:16S rRNA (guanine(527)-N(7))-methyltransferase RsmG [Bacteroidota bacterium]
MEKTEAKLELITKYFAEFSPEQLQQLAALDDLYRDWNNKINVISRKDIDSLYEKHILHSLSIAAAFEFKKGNEVIDIGTGGGFPGLPLAIFFPETNFHLVDSIGKKIKVVEAIASAIGLKNLTTQHIRAEEIKKRKFDCVVSRAVAPLKELWTWSKPLLRKMDDLQVTDESVTIPNGLVCLKGGDLANEISESGTRPRVMEIFDIFAQAYFHDKFIVYVPFMKR